MQFPNNTLARVCCLLKDRKIVEELIDRGERTYKLQKHQLRLITTSFIVDYFQKQEQYFAGNSPGKQEAMNDKEQSWSPNQLKIFTCTLLSYAHLQQKSLFEFNQEDILAICSLFPTKALNFIRYHHLFLCKSAVRQNRCEWKQEEIELLTDIIQSNCFERKWSDIAYELYRRSGLSFFKTSHQCREKWFNHLNPALSKEKWTMEQDIILFRNARDLGTKWAKISKAMGQNRTQHMIKNRFKSIAKRYENRFQRCTPRKRIENILKDLESKDLATKQKQAIQNEQNQVKEQPSLQDHQRNPESLETIKQQQPQGRIDAMTHATEPNFRSHYQSPKQNFNKIHSTLFDAPEFEFAQQKFDLVCDDGIIINLRQRNTLSDVMLIDYFHMDFEAHNKTIFSGSVEG